MEPLSVPDFEKVFDRLLQEECRFVLIGGLAMIAHGSTRNTFDTDISIARNRENVARLTRALAPLKPRPRGFPADLPFVWDETFVRNMSIATLSTSAGALDWLSEPQGVDSFEGLFSRAVDGDVMGRRVKVASVQDLYAMKQAAGRPKDLEDIRYLEIIQRTMSGG